MSDPTPDISVVSPVEIVPQEDKKEEEIKYIETLKFNAWCELFLDKSNKETFGNATQCALKTYDCKTYSSAGVVGHENLKKFKNLRLSLVERDGWGAKKMIDVGLALMIKRGMAPSWGEMMEFLGYKEEKSESTGLSLKIGDAEMKVVINRVV